MASTIKKRSLATVGGALVILLFCTFTLASAARYPGPFSPMDNWLSDLGTATKNPSGYVYFNTGCILTGVCLLLLVFSIGAWRAEDKIKGHLFTFSQAIGALSAIVLILIGAFDEGTPYHHPLAVGFFALQFVFIVLANIVLWGHPAYDRRIGYYAAFVAVINVVFVYAVFVHEHAQVWEWLAVISALLWVAFMAYNTLKLETAS
jgi:hypothetical membrane protein